METHHTSPPAIPQNPSPPLSRFITTHDDKGKAIGDTADFCLAYATRRFPAKLSGDADIPEYAEYLTNPPGLVIYSGTVSRIVDVPPAGLSPMHRTLSLDYGVVLEGEVELVLDSGETRLLKRGDVAVQRGTNHVWRNVTPAVKGPNGEGVEQWARMLYVLQPAKEIEVDGRQLGENLGGMGVRTSS